MSALAYNVFTKTLTGSDAITINTDDSITVVSVLCTSTTAGTILGTLTVGGVSPDAISVAENTSVTISNPNGQGINGVTITAPVGCTLVITAI